MPGIHKLTSLALAKLRSPGYYGDGGLVLQVSASGTKSWIFRYQLEGKRREMGLGPCSMVELAEARELARRCRQLLHQGLDPLADSRDARTARAAKKARSITFDQCAAGNNCDWPGDHDASTREALINSLS